MPCLASVTPVSDNSVNSPSKIQEQKSLTVDEVLTNPLYKDLAFNSDAVRLFKEVEKFRKENPKLTTSELSQQFDQNLSDQQLNSFSTRSFYDPYIAQWKDLTIAEKALVITSPGQALLV